MKKRNLIKNSEKIGSNVYGNNHSKVYSFVNKLIKNPDNKKNIQRKNNLLKDAFSTVEIFEKI